MGTRTARISLAVGSMAAVVVVATIVLTHSSDANARPVPFADARLKIEYNATDGDAGMQFFIDADEPPWRQVTVTGPSGQRIATFQADDAVSHFGLSELFSESSEPPFTELPFEEFERLFPEGRYTFTGTGIDGTTMRSTFRLTHDVPDGPHIVSPADGATVDGRNVVVDWDPVTTPAGVDVVAYEVIVVDEAGAPSGGE